jgi:hypothetical protein
MKATKKTEIAIKMLSRLTDLFFKESGHQKGHDPIVKIDNATDPAIPFFDKII